MADFINRHNHYYLIAEKTSIKEASENGEKEKESESAEFVHARLQYEYDLLKDPKTGKIPAGIFEQEKALARTLPVRGVSDAARVTALNTYIPAGPNNIGGRTRAVVYDARYATTRVILSGCVSGGIMRSADGGNNWTRVSPENEIHNLTALAQDPTNPQVWYAGGGEALGNTADELGAPYLGYAIWKSSDNGLTWNRLTLTIRNISNTGNLFTTNSLETFDHSFDFVHRIAVNPLNGDVYIAGHRRIIRSTDGGASFRVVLEGAEAATGASGQMDVTVSNTGKVFAAVNGGNPDVNFRGIWVSNTGNPTEWSRIAGGSSLGVDSVDGWRANSYNIIQAGTPPTYSSRRILITLAPSNNNIAYVYYENGLSSDAPTKKPEADFFRLDVSGTTYTWNNRSANMPDFAGNDLSNSDPLTVQGGYDMEVKVKPNDPNVVFIGGTNLYRSNDGFSSTTNTAWIAGYRNDFTYNQYANSHADIHVLAFNPVNTSEATCGNDGGIQFTTDIMTAAVSWTMFPNYQTLQYYNVAIDPTPGQNNFAGGAQDNGVRFRDKTGILGTPVADSNNHRLLFSADGAYVGISSVNGTTQYLFESLQFGSLRRVRLNPFNTSGEIRPAGLTTSSTDVTDEFGEFVTNLRLVADNSEDLYYVNFNRLFRTTSASTVTSSSGWTELTGVSQSVNPANPTGGRNVGIRGLGFSRGPYATSHALYLGTTNSKIFRIDNPRNADPTAAAIDITPTGLSGNVQDIAVNPNNDDEIMAVISNYGTGVINIWWTKNAKSAVPTWKSAEGNLTLPSIRSCAIVVKKDAANNPVTEYYVGTSVGLYSAVNVGTTLTNGGTVTWAREGGNVLNYAVVTSLAYRPADNVLLVGTHGNGMYYTYLGTANYTPNLNTAINPVTNDRNFIKAVFPTITTANSVQYTVGNMIGVKRISVEVINLTGQVVLQKVAGYQNGTVDIGRLARGNYYVTITSDDRKYRHIQKIIKQ